MFYEKYTLICNICAILCVIFYILTPDKGMKVYVPEVSAKEVQTATGSTATGVSLGLSDEGKENKNEGTNTSKKGIVPNNDNRIQCDATCKIDTLKKIGIRDEIAESLVTNCKEQNIKVINCIKLGASIVISESGGGERCYKNGCFGILAGGISYKTKEEGVKDWVKRFGKHWYNQKNPNSFYSNSSNWKPKTRYCLSEKQSDGTMLPYCKNGHKHAWNIFNKLEKAF